MRWRASSQYEAGSTLIEILIAIAILGIGVVALVGGLLTSVNSSATHRTSATADTIIRSSAEALELAISQTPPGTPWCAATYTVPTSTTLPPNYAVTASGTSCPAFSAPPSTQSVPQYQTITLTETYNNTTVATLVIGARQP
jgi:prepilin-type N-terminal cleavage/methylation domain-containing protein